MTTKREFAKLLEEDSKILLLLTEVIYSNHPNDETAIETLAELAEEHERIVEEFQKFVDETERKLDASL